MEGGVGMTGCGYWGWIVTGAGLLLKLQRPIRVLYLEFRIENAHHL